MSSLKPTERRLIIVSNRLLVVLAKASDKHWRAEPADGGLVNALAPVLHARGGVRISWPGTVVDAGIAIDRALAETLAITRTLDQIRGQCGVSTAGMPMNLAEAA